MKKKYYINVLGLRYCDDCGTGYCQDCYWKNNN